MELPKDIDLQELLTEQEVTKSENETWTADYAASGDGKVVVT